MAGASVKFPLLLQSRDDSQGEREAVKVLEELKSGGLVKAFGTGQQVGGSIKPLKSKT